MNTDRFNVNASLSSQWGALSQQHAGTGHPDITKREWARNQHRDSYASYIGHHSLLSYRCVLPARSLVCPSHRARLR